MQKKLTKEPLDCAIVGAGPAGIMAAIQAKRLGLSVAVFEKATPGGGIRAAGLIENLPGFDDGIGGNELAKRLLRQAKKHGVVIKNAHIKKIRNSSGVFNFESNNSVPPARSVIVAAGLVPKKLGVAGEDKLGARIRSYIDTAKANIRSKRIAIIGDGDAAFDQALALSSFKNKITIIMKHPAPTCLPLLEERALAKNITVLPAQKIDSLSKIKSAVKINFTNGELLIVDEILVCIGKQGCLDFIGSGLIKDKTPGLFFAGDCNFGHQSHIAMACGDGIRAAMAAAKYCERKL